MCGRFTTKMTWAEIVALYRLTMEAPPHNMPPRYNVCPTDPVDVVRERDGERELVPMRWGLVPRWWSKTLKDVRDGDVQCEGGDRRDQAVFPGCVQAQPVPDPDVRLLRVAGHARGQAALLLYRARRLADPDRGRLVGSWKNPETGQPLLSCTMIITEPNSSLPSVHDRMPVLLTEKQFEPWLSGQPASRTSSRPERLSSRCGQWRS